MTPYLGNFLGWILKFFYGVESQAWQLPYRDNQIMGERPMSMHAAFALMAHEMSPMVHVFLVSRLFPRWAIGQTWGRNVFVLAALINQEDLQGALHHEFIHVHQWRREGWWGFGFALEYIWLSIRHGYENNPLEVEARKLSTEN